MEIVQIIAAISQYEKIIADPAVEGNQHLHAQLMAVSLCNYLRNVHMPHLMIIQIIALVDVYDAATSKS